MNLSFHVSMINKLISNFEETLSEEALAVWLSKSEEERKKICLAVYVETCLAVKGAQP